MCIGGGRQMLRKIRGQKQIINGILFVVSTLLLLAGCYSFAANAIEAREVEALSDKVLRFHVIAESDSEDDQRRKLLVRDAVGEWMELKLQNASDRTDCEQIIRENMDQIREIAERTLAEDGAWEYVRVQMADVEFPDKVYGDYTFPAGTYRALQVIIGAGSGHNWWCVLYPNLCFSSEGYDVTGDGAKEQLTRVLSPKEYQMLLKEHRYRLKLRFLEKITEK